MTKEGLKKVYPKLNFRVTPYMKKALGEVADRANSTQSAIIKHCLAAELPKLRKKYGLS
jgi:predicted transcriptional regulator